MQLPELLLKRFRLDYKSAYRHSLRVAQYCRKMADDWSMDAAAAERLSGAAMLHEIGRLMTNDEYEIPLANVEIARQWRLESVVDMDALLQYGENLDGTGFPHGLDWQRIGFTAQLLRVADSFDRMTVSPAGNPLLPMPAAIEELYRWADVLYDAEVIRRFGRLLRDPQQTQYSKKF